MEVTGYPMYEQNSTFLFWAFKDFLNYVNHGGPILPLRSPELQCTKGKSKWILEVFRNDNHISVRIVGLTVTETLYCSIALSCLNSIYQPIITQHASCVIYPGRPVCLFKEFVQKSLLLQPGATEKLVPNGELLIQCVIIDHPKSTPYRIVAP